MNIKEELYDMICSVLTMYEHPDEFDITPEEIEDMMYSVLCKVSNQWEIITGGDE